MSRRRAVSWVAGALAAQVLACSGGSGDTDEVLNSGGGSGGGSGGLVLGGNGGAIAGSGGAIAGSGGAIAGSGGAIAGSGGAIAGSGGAIAGSGGVVVGGSGGAIAGTGGAHQGGYPGGGTCSTQPTTHTSAVIDDLEDGNASIPSNDLRHGFWYTFNDGTGTQQPPPGLGNYLPSTPGANGTAYAAYTSGEGFLGDTSSTPPMPAFARMVVPLFESAGPYDCPYDAAYYTGISFYAKGNVPIVFRVASVWTMPSNVGGFCQNFCLDHHSITISTLTGEWQLFSFTWDQLTQWGLDGTADPLDATGLLELQWEVRGTNALGPWEFAIDEVAFTGG